MMYCLKQNTPTAVASLARMSGQLTSSMFFIIKNSGAAPTPAGMVMVAATK